MLAMAIPLIMAGCAGGDGDYLYPRVVGNGENMMIDYGPGPENNIVGGGAVALSGGAGENLIITYSDRYKTQQPPTGMVRVFAQQGENTEIVWAPLPSNSVAAR